MLPLRLSKRQKAGRKGLLGVGDGGEGGGGRQEEKLEGKKKRGIKGRDRQRGAGTNEDMTPVCPLSLGTICQRPPSGRRRSLTVTAATSSKPAVKSIMSYV